MGQIEENVYGPDRGNSSASQRQQLPLQHDSSGALPRPQQPHQLPMNLPPALLEKHLLTVSLSQSTCTHIHLQPQPKSGCCPWTLLQLQGSTITMGRTASKAQPAPLWGRKQIKVQTVSLKGACQTSVQGLGETRKEREEEKIPFAARSQRPTSWVWGRTFLEQAMG